MIIALDEEKLVTVCRTLAEQDKDLAFIFERFGKPPLWAREPGFATLVHIILEQQVSLASAKSAFDKLVKQVEVLTPENFLKLNDTELKTAGFSRQKTGYARNLAEAILHEKLDLKRLESLPDREVKDELKKLKGIGDWTADIYLLMALLRPDVMPKGDLALHVAWQKLKNLEHRPVTDDFLITAERWKPFRAVAARLLWHFYLSERDSKFRISRSES
jgi:DNA-3-methyladenine glycosylase II